MSQVSMEQKIDEIYNSIINQDKLIDFLNVIGVALGFYNTLLNKQQISNNQIMSELDKQDKLYFEKIISILEELKGIKNDNK